MTLRVGIVGVGARAEIGRWVNDAGVDARLVAAVDVRPEAAARARRLFGDDVAFVTSLDDLGALDVDAAIVTTPDDAHADAAEFLLRAGVAVYLEKPLAITVEDCDRILLAAYESGSRLYVGHNMRHMDVVRRLRDTVASGAIGEVRAVWCRHFVGNGGDYYFKDWHAERARVGSLLLQKGAHDIDVIHWIAGAYTEQVVGMGDLMVYDRVTSRRDNSDRLLRDWFSHDNWPPEAQIDLNPTVDVEDVSMVQMRLSNGVLASYQQCHFTPDYWRNYTIIGTRGRAENFGDTEGGVVRVWNRRHDYQERGDLEFPIAGDAAGHGEADQLTMAEFLGFVAHGGSTATSPVAARQAVATGITATQSLRQGSVPMTIAPLAPSLQHYFDNHQVPA